MLASCAGLESWSQFTGGAAAGGGDSGADGAEDARPNEGGAEAGGDAGIAFVQVNAVSRDNQKPTSLAVPYLQAQNAGDLNVVIVGWFDLAPAISGVTDTSGNTYQLAVGPTKINGGSTPVVQSIYYAPGIAASAANANVVTVRWDSMADSPDVRVLEYRGLDKTAPLDRVSATSGNGITAALGAVTTRFASELLVNGGTTGDSYSVAPTGFTVRTITSSSDLAADRVVTTVGTYAGDAPLGAEDTWVMQVATFH